MNAPHRPPLRERFSLRAQLVLALLLLLSLALAGTGIATALALRSYLEERTDERLLAAARPFQRFLEAGGGRGGLGRAGGRRGPALPSDYVVAVLGPQGQLVQTFRNPLGDAEVTALPQVPLPEARERRGVPFGTGEDVRAVVYPIGDQGSLLVATRTLEETKTYQRLLGAELAVGAVALGLLGLLGWLAVTRSLRPLARIEETAETIAAGDLTRRVPEPATATTEVGRLSRALNGMLAQIERAFRARAESEARMRRFVSDASHELRTPLTSIRGFAELHRQGAVRDDVDVAAAMRRIEGEAVRMSGLVDDMLLLARLDEQRPLASEPVDLTVLAADAVADARAVAPDREVTLVALGGSAGAGSGDVVLSGDEARLRQVVANLVGNAVTHTPAGSPVEVRVGALDGRAVLEVADCGPGLTAEQAAHVFDRFYRVDAARTRASGGAGLGLSIVVAIVDAHHGTVTVRSRPGEGATFRVELPGGRSQRLPRLVPGHVEAQRGSSVRASVRPPSGGDPS